MAIKFKACLIDGCNRSADNRAGGRRGWCGAHYARLLRHGDPLAGGVEEGEPYRYFCDVVAVYEGDECLTWPYAQSYGYGVMRYEGRNHIVSRFLCERENGPPPTPAHESAHSCGRGNQACVTKRHLSWKTSTQNKADQLVHGTSPRGERNALSKLTEADVIQIRALAGTMSQQKLADQFGIARSTLSLAMRGKTWTHVK